jgi:hypothetical protein
MAGLSKQARNEQRKLFAQTLNTVGLGVLATGLITPFVTSAGELAFFPSVGCIIFSLFAHMGAQLVLQGLED